MNIQDQQRIVLFAPKDRIIRHILGRKISNRIRYHGGWIRNEIKKKVRKYFKS